MTATQLVRDLAETARMLAIETRARDALIERLRSALDRAETERLALCAERRQMLAEIDRLRGELAARPAAENAS